jgi:hypothetical protein
MDAVTFPDSGSAEVCGRAVFLIEKQSFLGTDPSKAFLDIRGQPSRFVEAENVAINGILIAPGVSAAKVPEHSGHLRRRYIRKLPGAPMSYRNQRRSGLSDDVLVQVTGSAFVANHQQALPRALPQGLMQGNSIVLSDPLASCRFDVEATCPEGCHWSLRLDDLH